MKKFSVLLIASLLLATPLFAQGVVPPTIGVYFDEAGTVTEMPWSGPSDIITAYVVATGGQFYLGGAAFALDIDPNITLVVANKAVDAVEIPSNPDLTTGVELGLFDPVFVDDAHPLVLYTLILTCAERPMGNLPISVVPHPDYADVMVAQNDGQQFATTGGTAVLTPPPPVVGVYFDTDATIISATFNGGFDEFYPAYVIATGGPLLVGGTAYRLVLDPLITLVAATYPPSVHEGDPLTGVEIGLYDAIFMDPQHPALLTTLILTTGDNIMNDATLCITNHPNYDTVLLAEPNGRQVVCEGACASLTIPVANEDRTWTELKDLYR